MSTPLMDALHTAAESFSDLVALEIDHFAATDWNEIQRAVNHDHPLRLGLRAQVLGRAGYATIEQELRNGTLDGPTLVGELSRLQALHQLTDMYGLVLVIRHEPAELDQSLWLLPRLAFQGGADQPLEVRVLAYYPAISPELVAFNQTTESC